jgi:tRNA(Ile)-lysidine synthase
MICEEVREAVAAGGLLARGDPLLSRAGARESGRADGQTDGQTDRRTDGRPILVMLSGGRDSTCLLDVAVALLGPVALSVELEVVRATGDAPIPAAPASGAQGPASTEGPGNLQAWARELRYAEAERIARQRDALIATGHTASDQVETILYRLAASPGRRALLGMVASEGRLIRPLLGITREQTAAYCVARGLCWREDESNDDRRYARSRVRHDLVPALRAVHPAAEANVLRTASLLREETELLDCLVADELAGSQSIALARLRELPAALARMVVVRLAEAATGAYVPQAGERVQEILALAGRSPIGRGGRAELHVGGQAAAVIDGGRLTMVKLPPRA